MINNAYPPLSAHSGQSHEWFEGISFQISQFHLIVSITYKLESVKVVFIWSSSYLCWSKSQKILSGALNSSQPYLPLSI